MGILSRLFDHGEEEVDVSGVLEGILTDEIAPGRSTPEDLTSVRRLFDDLAVGHVAQVRDVMLELQLGDVACSWVESSKPALRSLRAMAEQMELADLCAALDDFCDAVDAALARGHTVSDDARAALLARYQRLIELIPAAFELDAERDRREPLIVEALLRQVDGVERPILDKLRAVGLGRLDALLAANAEDIAATSGIRLVVAEAIVERLQAYRGANAATLAAPDTGRELRELRGLVGSLRQQHEELEQATLGWSDEARARRRVLRRERERTWLRVALALARLGERERIARLEKLPFAARIGEIEGFLALPRREGAACPS